MGISDREDFHGAIANLIELANDKSTGTKEMIAVISGGNTKQYLATNKSKNVEISKADDKKRDNRPDFSDLLDL